jgi:hypothetical protein
MVQVIFYCQAHQGFSAALPLKIDVLHCTLLTVGKYLRFRLAGSKYFEREIHQIAENE